MKPTSPRTWFLADPADTGELVKYLEHNKLTWRPDPDVSFLENLMEFGGRVCYKAFQTEDGEFENQNLSKTRDGNARYLGNILKRKHGSIFEHGNLVFLFQDVSRVFTHELVRHRAGTAFSQTSGRYVRLDEIPFWTPPVIENNPEAKQVFLETLAVMEAAQRKLSKIYKVDELPMAEKKKLTSAFRRIAPIGLSNEILFSTNHRALRHIISMRTDAAAEEEVRLIFGGVAERMKSTFPNIYQDMAKQSDGSWTFENWKV